ncbi:MAG: HugZ family protein [Kiloniellales bacterium]
MNEASKRPSDRVRDLLRRAETAALATSLARDGSGWPYPSLVLMTVDPAGCPLLLLSDLADHTANLKADPRAGLLVSDVAGLADPLTGARAAVLGQLEVAQDPLLKARILQRHPGASVYADFTDFNLYRLQVERAHLVAGFGQIHWIEGADVLLDITRTEALAAAEAEIVAHMNEDHADAIAVMAAQLLGLPGDGWRMTGVDPEGCDLRREAALARLDFVKPVQDAESCRVELVRLTKQARRRAAETEQAAS